MAILAVLAAVATGGLMALMQQPQGGSSVRGNASRHRVRARVVAAADAADGDPEPVAAVIPPDDVPEPPAWPPPLLNPMGYQRMAWDLSMGRPNAREILFTFDDGPNPGTTNRLLPILERAGIHAVFFVCGWRLEAEEPLRSRARQVLRDIVAGGHVVGNHTVHHHILPRLTPERVRYEIDHNADLIEEVIGQRPHLFRPPYGSYSEDVRRHVVSRRNELWLWSIDSRDWELVNNADAVAQRVIVNLGNHAGGTVLLHDTHPWSVAAVPKILRWIETENRDRAAHGRPVYTVLDPARYLEGARARLPQLEAQQAADDARATRGRPQDAGVDAGASDARVVPPDAAPRDAATAPTPDAAAPPPRDASRDAPTPETRD